MSRRVKGLGSMLLAAALLLFYAPAASATTRSETVRLSNGCTMRMEHYYTADSHSLGYALTQEVNSCSQVSVWFRYSSSGVVKNATPEVVESSYAYIQRNDVDYITLSMHRGINNNYWSTDSLSN